MGESAGCEYHGLIFSYIADNAFEVIVREIRIVMLFRIDAVWDEFEFFFRNAMIFADGDSLIADRNECVELGNKDANPERLVEKERIGDIESVNHREHGFFGEKYFDGPTNNREYAITEEHGVKRPRHKKRPTEGVGQENRQKLLAEPIRERSDFGVFLEPDRKRGILIFNAADNRRIGAGNEENAKRHRESGVSKKSRDQSSLKAPHSELNDSYMFQFSVSLLFCVETLLRQIQLLLDESSVGFDHVGKESKDDELEADDKEKSGEEKVVSVW